MEAFHDHAGFPALSVTICRFEMFPRLVSIITLRNLNDLILLSDLLLSKILIPICIILLFAQISNWSSVQQVLLELFFFFFFLASGEPAPSYTAYPLSSTYTTHPRGNKDPELALDLIPWVFLKMGEIDDVNAITPNSKTQGFETYLVLRNC